MASFTPSRLLINRCSSESVGLVKNALEFRKSHRLLLRSPNWNGDILFVEGCVRGSFCFCSVGIQDCSGSGSSLRALLCPGRGTCAHGYGGTVGSVRFLVWWQWKGILFSNPGRWGSTAMASFFLVFWYLICLLIAWVRSCCLQNFPSCAFAL